tara:strand:+ start:1469 stop:2083 length:615 start_codon:yes stop_codon:yes gene_type:complete
MADLAGFYPTTTAPASVEVRPITPTLITTTHSGKTRRTGYGGQYYELTLRYAQMSPLQARPIQGFMAAAFGPQLSFEIVLPEISYSASPVPPTGIPRTSSALARGGKTVNLTNCGANKTVLVGGDFFRFAGHSKVYQATNTCLSNASGAATLYFAGSATSSVSINSNVTITAVPFTMILQNPNQNYTVGIGGISTMTVEMREVW